MHRSWIIARCYPVLLVAAAAACASRGSTTNVTSTGNVVRDTAAVDSSAARRDTTAPPTRRDTAVAMPTTPPAAAGVELAVADAPGVGAYVTDAAGRAVYVIETTDNAFACADACATEFEPVIGKAGIATGATGLDASQLGTRALPDGREQATYGGKPLYFSRTDMAKGDTRGQGTKSYGNARLLTPTK